MNEITTRLHQDIQILLSTVQDSSMRNSATPKSLIDSDAAGVYLSEYGVSLDGTVLLRLAYDTNDFYTYREVAADEMGAGFTKPQTHTADALITRKRNVALFLPIADCIGAVLYYPPTQTLMLSHLGRHNLEQEGGSKSVEYLAALFGIAPSDLQVYLSPAADKLHYPLYAFDNKSLHEVAVEQLVSAGVQVQNIIVDARDTVTDPDFFSHSAALRGEKLHGRHAILCRMV